MRGRKAIRSRGKRIRLSRMSLVAARKERNLKQEDLAEKIGSSRWTISRIEVGHCKIDAVLSRKQIAELRRILGFSREHRASPGQERPEVIQHGRPLTGQFYAGIHQSDNRGRSAGSTEHIEKRVHQSAAELIVPASNSV